MILIPIGTDAPLRRRPVVNYAIIAINVAAYLLFNVLAQRFRLSELIALKRDMMLWPGSPTIWQFLTYQFLHADILHLLGNMWFLWLFGDPTNSKMGDLPYLLFYLAGGVFAGFGFALTETELPCLGASGSIAAVTTAYLVFFPRSVVRMFYWIFWFIGDFHVGSMPLIIGKMILWDNIVAMRLQSGGLVTVAYEAHLAGYAFGFLGGLLLLLIFFLPSLYVAVAALALGGMAWSLVNINSLPMVVDISASDADLGVYTGLYYIASQLAAVAGPTINGYIVEWGGGDYNLIFVVTPAFFALAILCMLGVTKGEAKMQAGGC